MSELSNLENRQEVVNPDVPVITRADPESRLNARSLEDRLDAVPLDGRPLAAENPELVSRREVTPITTTRTPAANTAQAIANADPAREALLFSNNDVENWRSQWTDVQAGFVDEPRRSVEQAEELVSTVLKKLADSFTNERDTLEQHWTNGETVSTEELRMALQRYRAFFGKLLNAA